MANNDPLHVSIDNPISLQGTISIKGIQFNDEAVIKIKG